MNIKILGPGCPNCDKLEQTVREIVEEMSIAAEIAKVKSKEDIMKYRIMMTPAIVIDEEVVCAGRIPGRSEIQTMITTALAKE